MKRTLLALLLISTLCFSFACERRGGSGTNVTDGGGEIVVGYYGDLTGRTASFGTSTRNGVEMAVDEINKAGGVMGRKVRVIVEDDQGEPNKAATVVSKLVNQDKVQAVLGEVASSNSLAAAPKAQEAGVPMISPSSTNPRVTEMGDFIFRVCFIDPFQGTVMADFAWKTLKARKVAIFTDVKSDYSKGLAQFFKERFTKNGGTIPAELDYNGGDKDFKAQLTSIKAANPDGVFIPGYYTDVALICIQARQIGLNVPLFGGDGWESEDLVKIGKEAVEGTYFSTHYHPDVGTELSRKFVDNYKKRYSGKTPDALAAMGYDSAAVLIDAMKRAGSTEGQKVRDAIAATKDFQGVTGKILINEKRDAVKSAVILQVKDGKYKYLETIAP